MTANLLEAVRHEAPQAALVLVSSAEVYGPPERLPVDERAPLRPQNPYAVSKAACDLLGGQYADAFGLRVVRLRPFNFAGPGQSDDYVIGTLTRQVAAAEAAGEPECVLRTRQPRLGARLHRRARRDARLRAAPRSSSRAPGTWRAGGR